MMLSCSIHHGFIVCPTPLTVGQPFEDTHPRTSRALRSYPWRRVLGQCSLRDTTPSQCLIIMTTCRRQASPRHHTLGFRKERAPSTKIGIVYGKENESAVHIAKVAAARTMRRSRFKKKGRVRRETSTCPCHGYVELEQ